MIVWVNVSFVLWLSSISVAIAVSSSPRCGWVKACAQQKASVENVSFGAVECALSHVAQS